MKEKKGITLSELAEALGGELVGDGSLVVNNISDVSEAKENDLSFIPSKKMESSLLGTKAACAIVPIQIKEAKLSLIKCKNPNLAFKKAVELIKPYEITHQKGIHKTASIGKDVKLGKDISIGSFTVIEDGVTIGDGTIIYAHSYIGQGSTIGENSVIYPNVTIYDKVNIGNRVIIHSGNIIGADGFGYERTEKGHEKIPQIGGVIIEDDVEIGASTTIDRAKISNTKIGRGTKIDNLVQIAHNFTIGENCIIVAQCGISGSVKIGNNVIMGGQVGIADHLEIGDNSMLAAQAAIMKSVPPNSIMWGKPARPFKKAKAIYALFDKLPEIYERLKAVEEKLSTK